MLNSCSTVEEFNTLLEKSVGISEYQRNGWAQEEFSRAKSQLSTGEGLGRRFLEHFLGKRKHMSPNTIFPTSAAHNHFGAAWKIVTTYQQAVTNDDEEAVTSSVTTVTQIATGESFDLQKTDGSKARVMSKSEEIGERQAKAKELREEGKTQREIAEELGVSQRTVSDDLAEKSEYTQKPAKEPRKVIGYRITQYTKPETAGKSQPMISRFVGAARVYSTLNNPVVEIGKQWMNLAAAKIPRQNIGLIPILPVDRYP